MGHQSLQRSFPSNFLETSSAIVNFFRADVAFGVDAFLDRLKFKLYLSRKNPLILDRAINKSQSSVIDKVLKNLMQKPTYLNTWL